MVSLWLDVIIEEGDDGGVCVGVNSGCFWVDIRVVVLVVNFG